MNKWILVACATLAATFAYAADSEEQNVADNQEKNVTEFTCGCPCDKTKK